MQACPYDMLYLASWVSDLQAGTPYFIARKNRAKCARIFLVRKLARAVHWMRMPMILIRQEWGWRCCLITKPCLNWQGLRCDVCYRVCPLIDKAITLEMQHNERTGKHAYLIPTVHSDACTGCGKCEEACVLEEAAIKVLPMQLAKGVLGHHYRFGWQEKIRQVIRCLKAKPSVCRYDSRR